MLRLSRHNQKFVPYLWLRNKPQKQNYHLAKDVQIIDLFFGSLETVHCWKNIIWAFPDNTEENSLPERLACWYTDEILQILTLSDQTQLHFFNGPAFLHCFVISILKVEEKKKKKRSEISIPAENSFRLKLSTAENSWHLSVLPLQPVYK